MGSKVQMEVPILYSGPLRPGIQMVVYMDGLECIHGANIVLSGRYVALCPRSDPGTRRCHFEPELAISHPRCCSIQSLGPCRQCAALLCYGVISVSEGTALLSTPAKVRAHPVRFIQLLIVARLSIPTSTVDRVMV